MGFYGMPIHTLTCSLKMSGITSLVELLALCYIKGLLDISKFNLPLLLCICGMQSIFSGVCVCVCSCRFALGVSWLGRPWQELAL